MTLAINQSQKLAVGQLQRTLYLMLVDGCRHSSTIESKVILFDISGLAYVDVLSLPSTHVGFVERRER